MPLLRPISRRPMQKNQDEDMDAPAPSKDLAIAYAVQKRNRKKMARGGMAKQHPSEGLSHSDSPMPQMCAHGGPLKCNMGCHADADNARDMSMMAEGGNVDLRESRIEPHDRDVQGEGEAPDEDYDSIADAIIAKKRRARMLADGGQVDLEANSEESPNNEDDLSWDAIKKEQYDLGQMKGEPRDSNESGDAREDASENDLDASMVDRIRKKMRMRKA